MTLTSHLDLGLLQPFHAAGILAVPDVQVSAALLRLGGHPLATASAADAEVALAAALCVRALRAGSVCIDLTADPTSWPPEVDPQDDAPAGAEPVEPARIAPPPWPDPGQWLASVRAHPLVAHGPDSPIDRPLRLVGSLLYLQRYWLDEQVIRSDLARRAEPTGVDPGALHSGLARLFGTDRADRASRPDRQRLAAATTVLRRATIIAGGPGTGKTTTVARIIALLREVEGPGLTVALAAPTGKAAARLAEAVGQACLGMDPVDQARVGEPSASTLHRLLGWRPDATGRFRHDRATPLPHDVVIVDETSMVSLPLMARLLEAVRPEARLVLVGDPDQLASIDAGAVLGDLVEAPPAAGRDAEQATLGAALTVACPQEVAEGAVARAGRTGVVRLDHNYRYGAGIGRLADAIRSGDPDEVLAVLTAGHPQVEFRAAGTGSAAGAALRAVRTDLRTQARSMVAAASAGDAATALARLEDHRVLCAHRQGPFGVSHWSALIADWTRDLVDRVDPRDPWYPGQPLLVTSNDYTVGLFNGDTGVIIAVPGVGLRAAFARGSEHLLVAPARLDTVTTLHAMTIHRGQGSQFQAVTVVLPPADSPLLTRELLYTASTRARSHIRLIGTPEAVRAAVTRQVRRASGLRTASPH